MRLALVLAATFASSLALASPSLVLTHSGRLLDGNDAPVTGTVSLKFELHTASAADSNDQVVWTDSFAGVPLDKNGLYSVVLGDTTPPAGVGHTPLTPDEVSGDRWLAISVDGTTLTPWLRIGMAPAAAHALDADSIGGLSLTDLDARYAPASAGATTLDAANSHADLGDAATLASAKSYADLGDATTLGGAKSYADLGDATTLGSAKSYADLGDATTLGSAKSYADTGDAATLASAKSYADLGDATTLANAKSYADTGDAATVAAAKSYADTAAAGGDASGTFSQLRVTGLQGNGVSADEPAVGQTMTWNGSQWAPSASAYGMVPIGSIVAWHKSLGGVPALPDGWLECNGEVVTDTASPLHGQTLPNLNGGSDFLRGSATSGNFQNASQVAVTLETNGSELFFDASGRNMTQYNTDFDSTSTLGANQRGYIGRSGIDSAPGQIYAARVRPVNMSVVWIMRVK